METLQGIVSQKVWEDASTGRAILTFGYESGESIEEGKLAVTAPGVEPGDAFTAVGEWQATTHGGRTENLFKVSKFRPDLPRSKAGVERFLRVIFNESKHGLGRAEIKRVVDTHGAAIVARAMADPEMLVRFSTRPTECRKAIVEEWERRTKGRRAVSLMEESGLETPVIDRIVSAWRTQVMDRLQKNPWSAARIPQVGFQNADLVGKRLGLPLDDPKRLAESVSEVLRKQQEQGSTCADVDTLLEHSRNVSGIRADVLESFLRQAIQNKNQEFVAFETPRGPVAASVTQYNAEAAIAQGLARLLAHGRRNDLQDVRAAADALFARPEFKKFDEIQRCAVMMAASEPISILTGGPGTGKSTVMEAVAKLSDMLDGGPLFLAAPVGKAAKRLSETTKRNASTVHRLLEARMNDDGESYFLLGRGKTLPPRSFVVVDETSMQDAELMAALIEALPPDGRLLLTGDDGQLPSVGAGAVLADMLSARVGGRPVIPAVKLEEVYRTDKDSGIAKGAALIREGVVPELTEENCGGVSFRPKAASDIVSEIERIVCEELVKQKIDPMRDVAVLCPQARGLAGPGR